MFLVILLVFGLGGAVPPVQDTTPDMTGDEPVDFTTTTLADLPSLAERLGPGIESLNLVADDGTGATEVLLWYPDSTAPRRYPISPRSLEASFDASGRFVAYLDGGDLYVEPTGHRIELPLTATTRGFAWHPTAPGRMAFGITGPTGTDILAGEAGSVQVSAAIVASVPGAARLVSWGDWGFAVALDPGAVETGAVPGILILDTAGVPVRVGGGEWVASAGGTLLLSGPDAATADEWTQRLADAAVAPEIVPTPVGIDLFDEHLDPYGVFAGDSGDSFAVAMDDGGRSVAIMPLAVPGSASGPVSGVVSITIVDFDENVPRVIAFDEEVDLIGFVLGGDALAVQSAATGELMVVDARTGATARLPLREGFVILDAWL